jgi:N-acetylglutamate synthase
MTQPVASEIETACLLAWPALETLRDGGWIARFARGYTKRANSIQSHDPADETDAAARIDALAQAYRARGLQPTFRITPLAGPGVIAALDAKGWQSFETSLVLAMPMTARARPVAATTRLFEPADPEWRQVQGAMAGYDAATFEALGAILDRIEVPARGVIVYDDAYRPAGAALGINAGGIAIFLNVVVDAAKRGQGYGRAVMNAALNWTGQSGASRAAIQVLADNVQAMPLYRSLGFEEVYSYHYRRPAS